METTIRYLKKSNILNRQIEDVWSDAERQLLKNPRATGSHRASRSDLHSFKKEVTGRKILGVTRQGKNIIFDLSGGKQMLIHQKMTGHLLVGQWKMKNKKWEAADHGPLSENVNQFIHLMFRLSGGKMLALSDMRKFAKTIVFDKQQANVLPDLKDLGPDPLEISHWEFQKRLAAKKGKIKQVLMDQKALAGIGNIYSDEILWEAGIHPLRTTAALSPEEFKKLYRAAQKILKEGIKYQGTSTSDYRKPDGKPGGYTMRRRVYQKDGEKCGRDNTILQRLKIGGRSAHFCPRHQK